VESDSGQAGCGPGSEVFREQEEVRSGGIAIDGVGALVASGGSLVVSSLAKTFSHFQFSKFRPVVLFHLYCSL